MASDETTSPETSPLEAAYATRRAVLGDEYVDAAMGGDAVQRAFQDHITGQAWSVWNRPVLSTRDRSLLVLAMTAAMGRMEEFALHARSAPRAGVADEEIDELLYQLAAYCGAPAAVSGRRVVREIRTARGESA